jgi:nucleoside-triphosphatase
VRGFFVGGPPGSGKTTVCGQIARMLLKNGMNVVGFITEEMQSGGKRVGFEAIDLMTGERAILAREKVTSSKGSKLPTVGKYVVNV